MLPNQTSVIPVQLFGKDFPVQGLINSIYAGRNVTVKNVNEFSFLSSDAEPDIVGDQKSCYMGYVYATDAAVITFSSAGKHTINTTGARVCGKLIIFDTITVDDSYLFWGWKITVEGSLFDVPASAPDLPGFAFALTMNGFPFTVSRDLINIIAPPVDNYPWFSQGISDFVLTQLLADQSGVNDVYDFTLLLPDLGGADADADYNVTGAATPQIANSSPSGANWLTEINNTVVAVAGGTIAIVATPGAGVAFFQNANDGDMQIVSVELTAGIISPGEMPVNAGEWKVGAFAPLALDDVDIVVGGTTGTQVVLIANGVTLPAQPYVGPGTYGFAAVDCTGSLIAIVQ